VLSARSFNDRPLILNELHTAWDISALFGMC
jgi:hypothetical protein